jgi:hypothetical protein
VLEIYELRVPTRAPPMKAGDAPPMGGLWDPYDQMNVRLAVVEVAS